MLALLTDCVWLYRTSTRHAQRMGQGTTGARSVPLFTHFPPCSAHFLCFCYVISCMEQNLESGQAIHFPGSRIILNNVTWGDDVNSWAKEPPAQVWELCYSSLTDNHDTSATFIPHAVRPAQHHDGFRAQLDRQSLRRLRALPPLSLPVWCCFSSLFPAPFSRFFVDFSGS